MKLEPVNESVVRNNPDHPLHHLLAECDQLNCEDPQEVQGFFEKMTVPQGYYALVTISWGYWIAFYESYKETNP